MNAREELIERIKAMTSEQIKEFLNHPTVFEIISKTEKGAKLYE